MFVLVNKKEIVQANVLFNLFTIMKVTINFVSDSDKFVGRVNLSTDESYKQLDEKGVENDVNQFSMDSFALEMALREKCKEYRKFALLGNGKL